MSDDLDFVPLTIAEVGRNNESGTTVLEQINTELQKLGRACLDEGTDGKATLVVKIDVKRTQQASLSYSPTVKVTSPGARLTGTMGVVDRTTGAITTQRTEQIRLPLTVKVKN